MSAGIAVDRVRVLQALGVTPLRLRARVLATAPESPVAQTAPIVTTSRAASQTAMDKRIALARTQAEVEQPALAALYTKITEAISALGLQCVRISDAENDPRVRVLAFGDVPLPDVIASSRVLRVDSLSILHADRARKRAVWETMQRLAREPNGSA